MKAHYIGQALARMLYLALVAVIVGWQWQQIANAPTRYYPAKITIPVAPGEHKIVGRNELAAGQAELNHLHIRHAMDGRWWIGNASELHAVEITRDGQHEELLRSVVLDAHSIFAVGGRAFQVLAIDDRVLRLAGPDGQHWSFDGVNVRQASGERQIACPDESVLDGPKNFLKRQWGALAPVWNRLVPSLESSGAVDFGGSLACDNRIALSDIARGAARIVRRGPAKFALIAAPDDGRLICLKPEANGACAPGALLQQAEAGLDTVHKMVVGRTQFDVFTGRDELTLVPRRRVALRDTREVPAGVAWKLETVDPWHWPFYLLDPWLALATGVAMAMLLGAWLTRRKASIPLKQSLIWATSVTTCLLLIVCAGGALKFGTTLAMTQDWWRPVAGLILGIVVLTGLRHVAVDALPVAVAVLLAGGMLAIVVAIIAAAQGTDLGVGWTIILEAGGLLSVVFLPQRRLLVWATFALAGLMFAIGAATQLSLGLAGSDSGSLRFFQGYEAKVAAGLFAWMTIAGLLRAKLSPSVNFSPKSVALALTALAGCSLLALAAQAVWGNEAGLGGFQPVELAKLALIFFAAVILASLLDWNSRGGPARFWLVLIFFMTIASLLVAIVILLSLVHDFSPLVLLVFWGGGMLVGWSVASGRALGAILAACLLATAIAGIAFAHAYCGMRVVLVPTAVLLTYMVWALSAWSTKSGAAWGRLLALALLGIGAVGMFYAQAQGDEPLRALIQKSERLTAWLWPNLHPHTGAQAGTARSVLETGGIIGGDMARPWVLPEVQNDMSAAYYLARFGALGGAALVGLQLLYLACLMTIASALIAAADLRNFQNQWLARVGFFAIWGYAFFLAGHFFMSWGVNLSILPIMGQPMPFLSVAGSLALSLLVPLQAVLCTPQQKLDAGT